MRLRGGPAHPRTPSPSPLGHGALPWRLRGHTQIPGQGAKVWPKGLPPQQTPPPSLKSPAQFKPRGFQFSLNIPFANQQGQIQNAKGASPSALTSNFYRPTSVNINTAFKGPPAAQRSKGSAHGPDALTEPSFQLGFSIPIPPPTPDTNAAVDQQHFTKPGPSQDGGSKATPVLHVPQHSRPIQTQQNLGSQTLSHHQLNFGNAPSGFYSVQKKPAPTGERRLSGQMASSDPPAAYHSWDYSIRPSPTAPHALPPPSGNNYGYTQEGHSSVISYDAPSQPSIQKLHFEEHSTPSSPSGHMASSNPTGALQSQSHQFSSSGGTQDGQSQVTAVPKEHHIYPEPSSQIQNNLGSQQRQAPPQPLPHHQLHFPTTAPSGFHSVWSKPTSTGGTRPGGHVASSDPAGVYQHPSQPAADHLAQHGDAHVGDYSVQPSPTVPHGLFPPSGSNYGYGQDYDDSKVQQQHSPSKQSSQIQKLYLQEYPTASGPSEHMASSNPSQSPSQPHQFSWSGGTQDGHSGKTTVPTEHHIHPEHTIQIQNNLGSQQHQDPPQLHSGTASSAFHSVWDKPTSTGRDRLGGQTASSDPPGVYQSPSLPAPDRDFPQQQQHTPSKQSIQIQKLHFQEYPTASGPSGHMALSNPTQSPSQPHQFSSFGGAQDGHSGMTAVPKEHHIAPQQSSQIHSQQQNLGFQRFATPLLPLPRYQVQHENTLSWYHRLKPPAMSQGEKPIAHVASSDTTSTPQTLTQNQPSKGHYLQVLTPGTDLQQTGSQTHSLTSSHTADSYHAPSHPVPDHQVPSGPSHSGYHSVQAHPTTSAHWEKPSASAQTGSLHSPSLYEASPSEYLQIPASGNDWGKTEQPPGSQQLQHNGQLQPLVAYGQQPESSPTAASGQFEASYSPSESNAGLSLHAYQPFESLPAPEKHLDRQPLHEKPRFTKLVVEAEGAGDGGVPDNFAPQTHQYNGYMDKWPGQKMAEPPSAKPQWPLPSNQHPLGGFGHEQTGGQSPYTANLGTSVQTNQQPIDYQESSNGYFAN